MSTEDVMSFLLLIPLIGAIVSVIVPVLILMFSRRLATLLTGLTTALSLVSFVIGEWVLESNFPNKYNIRVDLIVIPVAILFQLGICGFCLVLWRSERLINR